MTDITPADLAKFVHPVPVGATIPAGMEYASLIDDGFYAFRSMADHAPGRYRCWTAEPLAAPKPPLPTEMGAVIANVAPSFVDRDETAADTCAVMVRGGYGKWVGVDANGYTRSYAPNQITDWTPARVVTDEADAADEPEPLAAPKPPLTERVREFASEVLAAPPVGFSSVILDAENQQNRWIAEAAAFLAEIAERLDADR